MLEIGPSTVRRLPSAGESTLDGDMVAQALAGIDDTTVLLDERPVTVDSLWRKLISSGIGNDCGPVTRPAPVVVATAVGRPHPRCGHLGSLPRSSRRRGHR